MNNSSQAQKGFQTFVLTLSVSLIIFSIIYYFVTNMNNTPGMSQTVNGEVPKEETVSATTGQKPSAFKKLAGRDEEVAGVTQEKVESETQSTKNTEDTIMKKNMDSDAVTAEKATSVLAGAVTATPETPESTVPNGGVLSVTIGLFTSFVMFLISGWIIKKGPRNIALSRFEDKFLRD